MGTQELTKWVFPAAIETPESSPGTHCLGAQRRHKRAPGELCPDTGHVRSAPTPSSEEAMGLAGASR